jgi:hypothetical protein
MLQVFLLEKAVYELAYELNNRPDWVAIPMAAIMQLIGAQPTPGLPPLPAATAVPAAPATPPPPVATAPSSAVAAAVPPPQP